MLRSVLLEGFRSFEQPTAVRFAPLTILAGPNNAGKSSVIQALLALVQSEQASSGDSLLLSGAWCDLGRFDEVVSAGSPTDQRRFRIGLTGATPEGLAVDAVWEFGPREGDEPTLTSVSLLSLTYAFERRAGRVERRVTGFQWESDNPADGYQGQAAGQTVFADPGAFLILTLAKPEQEEVGRASQWNRPVSEIRPSPLDASRTQYVGPFRSPPQPLYTPRTSLAGPPLGRHGEHTAELLFRHRTQRTDIAVPGQPHDDAGAPILSAVNAWWSTLFGGSFALQIDAPARLGFTLSIDTPSAERLGLGQVGLGLSQALPIVTACLVSRPGDLLLIETPEAHLHPGAQHRLASLFIELAHKGRQVVIETHSEHLVTAVQIAVKEGLPPEDVALSFFSQEAGRTVVQEIELNPHGRALRWPPGFFDQAAMDLAELLR
jgi:energy-coupling factor transporter ATP-binding protein EcfA2